MRVPTMAQLVIAVSLLSAGDACVRVLPPAATPGPAAPAPRDEPIPEGHGRLYLDVVDGPTDVRLLTEESIQVVVGRRSVEARFLTTEPACTTPCVLDLPLGRHTLAFPIHGSRRIELDPVDVAPRPTIYRRALGSRRSAGAGLPLGVLGVTFGGLSFATGATLLPIGLATDRGGLTTAGGITLGAGAVLTAVGILAIAGSPSVEQPGAGAQYDLP